MFTQNAVDSLIGEFHEYLSDDSKQDASKNAAHITDTIHILVTNNIITQYVSTTWEETDGSAKHYTCEISSYIL